MKDLVKFPVSAINTSIETLEEEKKRMHFFYLDKDYRFDEQDVNEEFELAYQNYVDFIEQNLISLNSLFEVDLGTSKEDDNIVIHKLHAAYAIAMEKTFLQAKEALSLSFNTSLSIH